MRLAAAFLLLFATTACTNMEPADFKDTSPRFDLETYFQGETRAWGIFEDRFGTLRRQFSVDITGVRKQGELILDERFSYADGETDRRVWRIRKTGPHNYVGHADDIIGKAEGVAYGNALNWRYEMDLAVGDSSVRVKFDDWMFLQSSDVLLNRARVSKFGIKIGEVTLVFMKPGAASAAGAGFISREVDAVSLQAANE